MVFGFFFVRPIPLPEPGHLLPAQGHVTFSDRVLGPEAIVQEHRDSSHENLLLSHHFDEESELLREDNDLHPQGSSVDVAASSSMPRHRSVSRAAGKRSSSKAVEAIQDFHGNTLLKSFDFWLLFTILALCKPTCPAF